MTDKFNDWLTGIIAAATLAYVVVTFLLWRVTKKSADAAMRSAEAARSAADRMRETAEQQLRAYVCIDSGSLKFPQPGVPEAQVHVKNFGQTPAYNVRGWVHTWFGKFPLTDALPSPPANFRMGQETLAPSRRSIFIAARKGALPPAKLALLGSEEFTFYVYGEVRYSDIFGKERVTKYRLIHGGSEGARSVSDGRGSESWLLKPDVEGNESS